MRLFCFLCLLLYGGVCNTTGSIVLLLGTSSAGKTSIALELEKNLTQDDFTYIGVDTFHWKLMIQDMKNKRLDACFMSDDEVQHLIMTTKEGYDVWMEHESRGWQDGRKLCSESVRELALAGQNVIVDTVLGAYDAHYVFEQLYGLSVIIVWVYCDLENLIQHVQMRNNNCHISEKRDILQVLKDFLGMYSLSEEGFCDFLDRDSISSALCSMNNLSNLSFVQLKQQEIEGLIFAYNEKFFKSQDKKARILPKYSYDLLVNTSKESSIDIALKIKESILAGVKGAAVTQNYERLCL